MYDIHTVQEFWKMWAETLAKGNGTGLKIEGIDICYKMAAGTPHVSHDIPVGFDRMAEIHKTMPEDLRDIAKMHYYWQVYNPGAKPWLRMGLSQSK
ncbi:MAG: hypothetical protein GY928_39515, partial [Colwellia sp.]|nr:hypothetical protein [Colwellia sp.]